MDNRVGALLIGFLLTIPIGMVSAKPVDVDGDGIVGPLELIDVSLNWHSEGAENTAEKVAQLTTSFIHLSGPGRSRLFLDIDPDNVNLPRGLELRAETLMSGETRGFLAVKGDLGVNTISLDGRVGHIIGKRLFLSSPTPSVFLIDLNGQTGQVLASSVRLGSGGPVVSNSNSTTVQVPNINVGATVAIDGTAGVVRADAVEFGSGGPKITRVGDRIRIPRVEMAGADVAERFDITSTGVEIQPGMVVCIDPQAPGQLLPCNTASDRKVAGIVAGAGGIESGVVMGQPGTMADGDHLVALSGRVYCWVDASFGAVTPGDLLTTSSTVGHAMKVQDVSQSTGAILGKALTPLESGVGLVLVLVSLQ